MNKPSYWYLIFYRNGYLLTLSIVLLLVAGLSALQNLPRLEDPRIDNRNLLVLTPFPGASAERVEVLVTDVLEKSLRQLDEIDKVTSTSMAGLSSISIELQPWVTNANNEQIFSKVRDRIAQDSRLLPEGAGKPELDDKRGATAFTMIVALKHPQQASVNSLMQLSRLADELADRLRLLSGTELVRQFGAVSEEVLVTLNPEQIHNIGLSLGQVSQRIVSADAKQSAGSLNSDQYHSRLQLGQEFEDLSALRQLPLMTTAEGAFLTLGDVADIHRGVKTPRHDIALLNGEEAIFIAARMRTSVRVDHWTSEAEAVIAEFNAQYHGNLQLEIIFKQSEYTEARLTGLTYNLLMGCAVVILVVLFFMGSKAALIVGLSLPLSAAFATFSLSFFNQQIHQMTIFGMILAVGLLIDNAIVITDEIRKRIQVQRLERSDALHQSLLHLSGPLTASTLTTILAFMPVFLLPGNVGDFVRPIAISVVMALLGALIISFTIIAALAARFIPLSSSTSSSWYKHGWQSTALTKETSVLMTALVAKPWRTTATISLLAISGVVLSSTLSNVFFPDADRDQFQIYMWMPTGSSIESTRELALAADEYIRAQSEVEQVIWLIGGSIPSVYYNQIMNRDATSHFANGVVTASNIDAAAQLTASLQHELTSRFPAAKFVVRSFSQGPPVSAPIAVEIVGPDLDVLAVLGQQVRLAMTNTAGITESIASIDYQDSELHLNITPQQAALAGLTIASLNQQVFNALEGVLGGSILQQTEEIPIRVKLAYAEQRGFEQLLALGLLPQNLSVSQTIPLHSLWPWKLEAKISGISRTNGQRVNIIEAFTVAGAKAIDVNQALNEQLRQQLQLPEGYRLMTAGDAGEQQQAIGQLSTFLPVLAVLMFATLILTFKSVRYALLVFTVAALSAGFGLLSLWISGLPMGFNPLLGVAGLVGVAINGSIVVIAAVNALPIAQRADTAAIVSAAMGSSRHILSTTVTTVGGLIPLLLFSEGSFWPPLAVVMAGGVGFSILLSLVFTPAALRILEKPASNSVSSTLYAKGNI